LQGTIKRRIARFTSLALLLCIVTSLSSPIALHQVVRADAPSVSDFGGPVKWHPHTGGRRNTWNALFVTEHLSGDCRMEEHAIHDDGITLFRSDYPAWQLNVPLTWYFMEPVYERNTAKKEPEAGRIAV
jgi:hypothetical protein